MVELDRVEPASRAAWHAWLARHHADRTGVWLVLRTKGDERPFGYEDAVEDALCFGWIDSRGMSLGDGRSQLMFTPRRKGGIWARSTKQRVARLVAAGRMEPAGLAAVERAQRDGSWTAYDPIEDLVMPDDLGAALRARPEAERIYARWPRSRRKMALWMVASAKRPETRARRIAEVVRRAAEDDWPR